MLCRYLVPIMNMQSDQVDSLLENTAITIGRLGLVCPGLVARFLEKFAKVRKSRHCIADFNLQA